jgi:hypothetical protein
MNEHQLLSVSGPHIIEGLVRWPPVQVRGWFLTETTTDEELREMLLGVRRLGIADIIAATSNDITERILKAVCRFRSLASCNVSLAYFLYSTKTFILHSPCLNYAQVSR